MNMLIAAAFTIIYGIRLGYQAYLLRHREKAKKEGDWAELLLVIVPKNILVGITVYMLYKGVPLTITFWVGWFIFLAGIALRIVALRQLGSMYSMNVDIREKHKIVKNGVYSFSRHPLYLAYIIDTLGVIIFLQKIYFYPIIIFTIVGLAIRIRNEERGLISFFGDEYIEYSKHVPALNIFKKIIN